MCKKTIGAGPSGCCGSLGLLGGQGQDARRSGRCRPSGRRRPVPTSRLSRRGRRAPQLRRPHRGRRTQANRSQAASRSSAVRGPRRGPRPTDREEGKRSRRAGGRDQRAQQAAPRGMAPHGPGCARRRGSRQWKMAVAHGGGVGKTRSEVADEAPPCAPQGSASVARSGRILPPSPHSSAASRARGYASRRGRPSNWADASYEKNYAFQTQRDLSPK